MPLAQGEVAEWGDATVCNAVHVGSNPTFASKELFARCGAGPHWVPPDGANRTTRGQNPVTEARYSGIARGIARSPSERR